MALTENELHDRYLLCRPVRERGRRSSADLRSIRLRDSGGLRSICEAQSLNALSNRNYRPGLAPEPGPLSPKIDFRLVGRAKRRNKCSPSWTAFVEATHQSPLSAHTMQELLCTRLFTLTSRPSNRRLNTNWFTRRKEQEKSTGRQSTGSVGGNKLTTIPLFTDGFSQFLQFCLYFFVNKNSRGQQT